MLGRGRMEEVKNSSLRGGARLGEGGAEFALFSRHAQKVELCLFSDDGQRELHRLALIKNDDGIWRGFLPGAQAGLLYGYRVHGPWRPDLGMRFNPAKLLVDPFARKLAGRVINDNALIGHELAATEEAGAGGENGAGGNEALPFSLQPPPFPPPDPRDSAPFVPKAVLCCEKDEEKREFSHPRHPLFQTIIYELHVKGFTRLHPDIPEELRGTFQGLASPPVLDYIAGLGVTAIELLPVFPFNDEPHLWKLGLSNYWGYNPYNFFAPDPRYGGPEDFRAMVHAFHQRGIEVILDVVYNHSGEGDEKGPILSLRGIDNASFYRLRGDDPALYVNDTGCGNMLDFSQPYVREMALASLRYWVEEMGVDGFRFDLAPILGRSPEGFSPHAPFFEELSADPALSGTRLIAEPWDIGPGGYQLGNFPCRWAEWNDQYRDNMRSFWRGDEGQIATLAARLTGSADLLGKKSKSPFAGVNFIASHDGFTLHDLVSYNQRHNQANGEDNRDGHGHNLSANYGHEGESDDPEINAVRQRQMRNMLASLFFSQGLPMLAAGDELGRSQQGNNNAYCQDNEISWLDWSRADHALCAFVRKLTGLRREWPQLHLSSFLSGKPGLAGELPDSIWLSPEGREMNKADWALPFARCVGLWLAPMGGKPPLLLLLNAHHGEVPFILPGNELGGGWELLLSTSPEGGEEARRLYDGREKLVMEGRSLLLLAGKSSPERIAEGDELYTLHDLGEQAGLISAYGDLSGQIHVLDDDSRRLFLEAMGFDLSSPGAIDHQVRDLLAQPWLDMLPPSLTIRKGRKGGDGESSIIISLPASAMGERLTWRIELENGRKLEGEIWPDNLKLVESSYIREEMRLRLKMGLPDLPLGYHRLETRAGEQHGHSHLIITPPHCHRPQWMEEGKKIWGIACQMNSLMPAAADESGDSNAADWGIGDFALLNDLARAAGEKGAGIIGLSPLHALFPFNGGRASPYSPSSRRFGNCLYLAPELIRGWDDLPGEIKKTATGGADKELVDLEAVRKRKWPLFEKLFELFISRNDEDEQGRFEQFRQREGEPLEAFARFCALDEHFGGKSSSQWPPQYQNRHSPEVRQFAGENRARIDFHCWLQWQFDLQMAILADDCRKAGMRAGPYGDLAVGAAADGAEAWADPESFLRSISFGAPPDAFNSEGQNWAMPPLDPRHLAESGFAPFRAMLEANMRHCGALRIDHVMWLERMFLIPHGQPASRGAYMRYPLDDLLAVLALESERAECLVVGEDLGTLPPGFGERMESENILSYRLMRFEKLHDGSFSPPHDYPYLALATPSSHDLPTLRGFLAGEDIRVRDAIGMLRGEDEASWLRESRRHEIRALVHALANEGLWPPDLEKAGNGEAVGQGDETGQEVRPEQYQAIIMAVYLYLARSGAAVEMINLEDLAGALHQVNIPGTVNQVPNWRRRLAFSPARLAASPLADFLARLAKERQKKA